MNERIRELWAQCVVKHTKTPMNWQDVADEFAELLIRECVEQCDINFVGTVGTHSSAHNRGVKKCIDNIKQHFGVSE